MTRVQWFALPLKLRQRWWRETDYNTRPPNDALKDQVKQALANKGIIISWTTPPADGLSPAPTLSSPPSSITLARELPRK